MRRVSVSALNARSLVARGRSSVRFRITAVASVFVLLVTAVGSVVLVATISHTISNSLVDSARLDAAAIDAQLEAGCVPGRRCDDRTQRRRGPAARSATGNVVASDRRERLTVPLRTTPGVTESAVVPGRQGHLHRGGQASSSAGRVAGSR